MVTKSMPDDTIINESEEGHRSGIRAGRPVRRSSRSRAISAKRLKKLIPPAEEWDVWDELYGVPVLSGEIVVGDIVYRAVLRHYEDLQEGHKRGLKFSREHAWHVIQHIENHYQHIKGPLAGEPLKLDPWQLFWTAVLYGWLAQDGLRRFTRSYEEVARKNGKSTWKGPQGGYLFCMDGESGAEVYAVASTREQAMTVFKPAFENVKRWAKKSPKIAKSFEIFKGANQERITFGTNVFKPLAANADSQDGFNPSAILFDELHAQKSREQWDVLESAMGARTQPLMSAITTAGFILDGICTELRSYLISVLKNEIEDDSFFGYIYTLDEGDDPFLEQNWYKANPALGLGKTLSYMRNMAKKAKALPSALANFKTKDLNIWCNTSDGWLDIAVWDEGKEPFDPEILNGRTCYGGLDLASTRDLTAFSLIFPPEEEGGIWHVLVRTWCPREKVNNEADDAAPYATSEREGWLEVTEGNVTDYNPVKKSIVEASKKYNLEMLGFDNWNAQDVINQMTDEGIVTVQIPQNTQGMYPGTRLLEVLIYDRRLKHGGNRILRYAASNVALLYDSNDNFRPDKKNAKNKGRIDPLVATVIACSTYSAVAVDNTEKSFWDTDDDIE